MVEDSLEGGDDNSVPNKSSCAIASAASDSSRSAASWTVGSVTIPFLVPTWVFYLVPCCIYLLVTLPDPRQRPQRTRPLPWHLWQVQTSSVCASFVSYVLSTSYSTGFESLSSGKKGLGTEISHIRDTSPQSSIHPPCFCANFQKIRFIQWVH